MGHYTDWVVAETGHTSFYVPAFSLKIRSNFYCIFLGQPLVPTHVEPGVVERLLAADPPAPVCDEHFAEEVLRLGRDDVPGRRREAVGALERVHQRLGVRAPQERRLTAQPEGKSKSDRVYRIFSGMKLAKENLQVSPITRQQLKNS